MTTEDQDDRCRSNSTPEESTDDDDDDDVTNPVADNCATGTGCRNACCRPSRDISTINRSGDYLRPAFPRAAESSTTLSSSSSSSDVTETASARTNCSTPPEVDVMTSRACAVRETAIMGGDSSDERLERTGNCCGTSGDVITPIRRPLYSPTTNSSRQSLTSSFDLLNRDFVSRLDHGPETDILFSESASDVDRKSSQVMPEMETYLRLPPTMTLQRGRDLNSLPPSTDAATRNRNTHNDGRRPGVVKAPEVNLYPEVNSTTSTATTTTTMSMGRRSSSAGAINHVADLLPTLSSSLHRRSTIIDRQRRSRAPKPEVHRRVTSPLTLPLTSPLDRDATTTALELRRAQAKALANWAKLREHFRLTQVDVEEPRFRAAALRLLENEARRPRSTERHAARRTRSSGRVRRRCLSVERATGTQQRQRSRGANNAADNPAFHHDPHPRLSDPGAAVIPLQVSADNISSQTADVGAGLDLGAALPYDYEPLSFDDVGVGGPFSYVDDPFDYDDTGDRDGGKVTVPITICLVIIAGYIFAGAVLFTLWEDWDYLTGSYFCFITLSTIGFGDIVPGTDMDKWASSEKLVLCALWLAFGLSLLAMCFNLMQEEVKEKCKWIGLRLGLLRDDEPQ